MTGTPRRAIVGWLMVPMLLSGCASMNRNQCVSADRYAVGLEGLMREAGQLEQALARLPGR